MLAEFTKMSQTQSSIGKHPLLNFTNSLFVLWCSGCIPIITLHLFTKLDASLIQRRKDILSEIKSNQRVAGRLTFDLLTQRSIFGFLSPFIFWIWSKKHNHCKDLEILHWQKCSVLESYWPWPSTNWPLSVWKYSFYENIQLPICCTSRQTELRNNWNMSKKRALHIDGRLRGDNNGFRTEMTSALHEVIWKMMNLIPRQCERKTIIGEPSSTGNLNKVVIHSLSTRYFVNTPLILNGGSISFPFCRKPIFCK